MSRKERALVSRKPYTIKEITRAQKLRGVGLTWNETAEKLGRQVSSLQGAIRIREDGKYKGTHEKRAKYLAYAEELVGMGTRPIEMVRLGMFNHKSNASAFLLSIGLDLESRVALQIDKNPRVSYLIDRIRNHARKHGKSHPGHPYFTDELCGWIDELGRISEVSYKDVSFIIGSNARAIKQRIFDWRKKQDA